MQMHLHSLRLNYKNLVKDKYQDKLLIQTRYVVAIKLVVCRMLFIELIYSSWTVQISYGQKTENVLVLLKLQIIHFKYSF